MTDNTFDLSFGEAPEPAAQAVPELRLVLGGGTPAAPPAGASSREDISS